jgi:hypothetical protein
LGNFEMAEIQALRPIVAVQRSRHTRSIKWIQSENCF